MTAEERFWVKVEPGPLLSPYLGRCWLWTGWTSTIGYGQFYYDDRDVAAHRFIWELMHGSVPDGLELDHLCRIRRCVNPAHLEPVTHEENMRRSWRSHCVHGHPLSGENLRIVGKRRRCRICQRDQERKHEAKKRALVGEDDDLQH